MAKQAKTTDDETTLPLEGKQPETNQADADQVQTPPDEEPETLPDIGDDDDDDDERDRYDDAYIEWAAERDEARLAGKPFNKPCPANPEDAERDAPARARGEMIAGPEGVWITTDRDGGVIVVDQQDIGWSMRPGIDRGRPIQVTFNGNSVRALFTAHGVAPGGSTARGAVTATKRLYDDVVRQRVQELLRTSDEAKNNAKASATLKEATTDAAEAEAKVDELKARQRGLKARPGRVKGAEITQLAEEIRVAEQSLEEFRVEVGMHRDRCTETAGALSELTKQLATAEGQTRLAELRSELAGMHTEVLRRLVPVLSRVLQLEDAVAVAGRRSVSVLLSAADLATADVEELEEVPA